MNQTPSGPRRYALALFLFLVAIYAIFPTSNHYWDGIGFALNIEGSAQDGTGFVLNPKLSATLPRVYYNPNHLLHNLFGFWLFVPLRALFPHIRAHDVLVTISTLLSASTCCLIFAMLCRWTANLQLSLWTTLLMAFSATWWKFSTDVDTYIPPVFLLTLATWTLTSTTLRHRVLAAGLLHALAMLFHQIAIIFLPAALYEVWRQDRDWRSCLRYLLAAALPVLASYGIVWFSVLGGPASFYDFSVWLTSNGSDVYSYRSLAASLLENGRSLIRLFFGGKFRNAVQFIDHKMLWLLAPILVVALLNFFREALLLRKHPKQSTSKEFARPRGLLLVWLVAYLSFLTFWLTEYSYYRLFCLPALILLIGVSLNARAMPVLRAFVVIMALSNFTFYIYPYSKPEATPPVHLAKSANSIWKHDELVLFKEFTCDNWIMKHFNPKTRWHQTSGHESELKSLTGLIDEAMSESRGVWIDTSLLAAISASPASVTWVRDRFKMSHPWGISTSKHHIQFVQLAPLVGD